MQKPECPIHARVVKVKVKGKGHTLDIAPLCEETSLKKRSGMARIVEGFYGFTCTPTHSFMNGTNHDDGLE